MTNVIAKTPPPVMGLYDAPLWQSIRDGDLKLQRSRSSGKYLYPPAPVCDKTLADDLEWVSVSGKGEILSWIVFHRQYLDAYPPPHNVIAVRLDEGPVIISNLQGRQPEASWIGRKVRLIYTTMPDGFVLPRFELSD